MFSSSTCVHVWKKDIKFLVLEVPFGSCKRLTWITANLRNDSCVKRAAFSANARINTMFIYCNLEEIKKKIVLGTKIQSGLSKWCLSYKSPRTMNTEHICGKGCISIVLGVMARRTQYCECSSECLLQYFILENVDSIAISRCLQCTSYSISAWACALRRDLATRSDCKMTGEEM